MPLKVSLFATFASFSHPIAIHEFWIFPVYGHKIVKVDTTVLELNGDLRIHETEMDESNV